MFSIAYVEVKNVALSENLVDYGMRKFTLKQSTIELYIAKYYK